MGFKGRDTSKLQFAVFRVGHSLRLFRFIDDNDERRTLRLLGEDNFAVTDGLWVIWALILLSIHCEILVDYFHTN